MKQHDTQSRDIIGRLPPWDDGVRAYWRLFHPARVERWERIYKERLAGAKTWELAIRHKLDRQIVELNILTVQRSLRLLARNREAAGDQVH